MSFFMCKIFYKIFIWVEEKSVELRRSKKLEKNGPNFCFQHSLSRSQTFVAYTFYWQMV